MADSVSSGSPDAGTPGAAKSPWRRRLRRIVAVVVVAPVALHALWTWIALHWSYSEGSRAGYVQKFSRTGWVCKTWEGELAMVNLPGAVPEIFRFTVRDPAVAERITAAMGQRVALNYEQHIGVPFSCFGDTQHFVQDVRIIGP